MAATGDRCVCVRARLTDGTERSVRLAGVHDDRDAIIRRMVAHNTPHNYICNWRLCNTHTHTNIRTPFYRYSVKDTLPTVQVVAAAQQRPRHWKRPSVYARRTQAGEFNARPICAFEGIRMGTRVCAYV